MRRRAAAALLGLAAVGAAAALALLGAPVRSQENRGDATAARGRLLFQESCSSCHGFDARGVRGRGPTLRGVGELSADFYLRTGRMPLDQPDDEPRRTKPQFDGDERRALVAYVGSFGGPRIPQVHPDRGELSVGLDAFTENCAGCHQVVARGGISGKGTVPDLQDSKPVDVAEAVQIGPYVMPNFRRELDQHEIDSIARYVQWTKHPQDEGGWGLGHIGPIPEGMLAWLLAGALLIVVIRLLGERTSE
jgi:ubiquinol-cytochrome c reductase cytochrome c subunit